jgi:hypothetical protein
MALAVKAPSELVMMTKSISITPPNPNWTMAHTHDRTLSLGEKGMKENT